MTNLIILLVLCLCGIYLKFTYCKRDIMWYSIVFLVAVNMVMNIGALLVK